MADPISIGISLLVGSAPHWFPALRTALWNKGKDLALEKSKDYIKSVLDEKKHRRHVELALQNAAEQGLRRWRTPEDRDRYRSILEIVADRGSGTLRLEAMQLFTLYDNPDLVNLAERYDISHRVTAIAHHMTNTEFDAVPYLQSFFEALWAALYEDPLFRDQISDVIRTRSAIQQSRSLIVILDTLNSIQQKIADDYSLEQMQQDVNIYLNHIEGYYRLHKFAGIVFRGDEEKAPELDGIFVPLRIEQQSKTTDKLITLLNRSSYMVLLGGPGSGKSISTCYLAWSHAKANLALDGISSMQNLELLVGTPVPLRIELRLFSEARKSHPGYSFLSYATEVMLKQEEISISNQMFVELLKRRALFVLFDGLDEVPSLSERQQFTQEIENFAERYPGNYILVTSRPIGYELASITHPLFQQAEILEFDNEQIRQFLTSWYRCVLGHTSIPLAIRQERDLFYATLTQNSHLHKLAVNPLLLTVMTALHRYERLPDRRVQIYERCAALLLDTWAHLKYKEKTRWQDMKMGKRDQLNCIAYLGFVLHQRSQENADSESSVDVNSNEEVLADTAVDVPANFIRRAIKQFLMEQDLLAGAERNAEADRFLELVQREAGLIVSRGTDDTGEALYGFVHRTFQEYFAAVHILNLFQDGDATAIPQFLRKHVHDPHWHEVILLLISNLQHKQATRQLRLLLIEGTERSKYSDVVKQDLFFVGVCLADGISTEENFAEEVLSLLQKVIEETSFPSQLRQAISTLIALRHTQRYADLSRNCLQKYMAGKLLSLDKQIQLAQAIYENSSDGSDEKREGARLLITCYHQGGLSLDQQIQLAQAIYEYSPDSSDEKRKGAQLLIARCQQGDLSLGQRIQLANAIYQSSPDGSNEKHEGARLLIARYQQGDLSLDQQIQLANAIYENSPFDSNEERQGFRLLVSLFEQDNLSLDQQIQLTRAIIRFNPAGSDERRQCARLLIARYRQGGLSLDQQIQLAKAMYQFSPFDSDERRQSTRLLISLFEQSDLPLDQQIQLARAMYQFSPADSNEKREGVRLLIIRYQRGDLSLDQQIQLANAIYENSPAGSDEEREGARLLIIRYQRGDLSLDQQIQLARAIIQFSPSGSDEKREGARLLVSLFEQDSLSLDQQIQLALALYQFSPAGSDEMCQGFKLLQRYVHMLDITYEQRLRLATAPFRMYRNNFSERAEAIRWLLAFNSRESVADILSEAWKVMHLFDEKIYNSWSKQKKIQYNRILTEIPAIYELAKQVVLSVEIRDDMYQLLLDMVSLFNHPRETTV
jgi:hypothetical protein